MATNSVTSKFDPMINKAESNKNRDTEFIGTLVDGQRINFYLENNNLEKYKSNKNKNVEDNYYIYDENTDKLYYREIRYPEYFGCKSSHIIFCSNFKCNCIIIGIIKFNINI